MIYLVSMVFQNSWHTLGNIIHVYCPTSKKLYVLHRLVEILQWNPIGVLLIYACKHMLRNTLESSLMLLEPRCLQSFLYSESLFWLQLSALTFQDFHQIWFLPCIHPCMVSMDLHYMGNPLERSYCLLNFDLFQGCFQRILFDIWWWSGEFWKITEFWEKVWQLWAWISQSREQIINFIYNTLK